MNILFLSLIDFTSLDENGIYSDLLREMVKCKCNIYCISPSERRKREKTRLIINGSNENILKLRIGNIQKTNMIEKGISMLLLENHVIWGLKKYWGHVKFDLVLYCTPPVTFAKAVKFIKKRDCAKTYLLLKDIFPQNSVDLGLIKKNSLLHRYFSFKEKQLYFNSDYIGCMSKANVKYVLTHNAFIDDKKVEICPNSVAPIPVVDKGSQTKLRKKYNVPDNVVAFLYGGNLGKAQGVDFIIECLRKNAFKPDRYFIICASGTEYRRLKDFVDSTGSPNIALLKYMPKNEYFELLSCCDVGLIFLDSRFTIPNFPSRTLDYMQFSLPVIAAVDSATDFSEIIEANGFGLASISGDLNGFINNIEHIMDLNTREKMGGAARSYLEKHWTAKAACDIILAHFAID